jgi:hypothetical protein
MMKNIIQFAIICAGTLTYSCAFDGPSRPDIPVSGNIVLYSGPGDAGKYDLSKHEKSKTGDFYEPLTGNDSLRKIIVGDSVVFVETIDWEKKAKYYRFTSVKGQSEEKVISKKKFDEATQDCPKCKTIPIPPDEKP